MHKPITLIIGPPMSGKTYLAKKASRESDTVYLDGRRKGGPFIFENVTETTHLIILDEVLLGDLEHWLCIFSYEKIVVDRRGQSTIELNMPEVIITSQCTSDEIKSLTDRGSFQRLVKVIHLK